MLYFHAEERIECIFKLLTFFSPNPMVWPLIQIISTRQFERWSCQKCLGTSSLRNDVVNNNNLNMQDYLWLYCRAGEKILMLPIGEYYKKSTIHEYFLQHFEINFILTVNWEVMGSICSTVRYLRGTFSLSPTSLSFG